MAAQGASREWGCCLRDRPRETGAGAWAGPGGQHASKGSRERLHWEKTALVLMSHWPLSLWPGAVAGRLEGAQPLSPILPSMSSGFQLWVGSAAYPVSLAGHTDFPSPISHPACWDPGAPTRSPSARSLPFRTCSLADPVPAAKGPAGVGQEGLYSSWGLHSGLGGSPTRGTAKQHAFSPRTTLLLHLSARKQPWA